MSSATNFSFTFLLKKESHLQYVLDGLRVSKLTALKKNMHMVCSVAEFNFIYIIPGVLFTGASSDFRAVDVPIDDNLIRLTQWDLSLKSEHLI